MEKSQLDRFEQELEKYGIPSQLAASLKELGKDKSTETWESLLRDLEPLSQEERIEATNKIIEKAGVYGESIKRLVKPKRVKKAAKSKYPQIALESYKILDELKKIECLSMDQELKELTEELDEKRRCVDPVAYVCHHCKKVMCSQHSYWIPDEDFPYIVKKITRTEIKEDEEKIAKANRYLAIGILLLCIVIGIYFIWKSIQLKKEAKFLSGWFFPSYFKKFSTKWGKDFKEIYEHQGYYLAVHCWDCLKKFHSNIYDTAVEIMNLCFNRAKNWKIQKGDFSISLDENTKIKCSIYAANLYLREFKYGMNAYLKLKKDLRELERPLFKSIKQVKVGPQTKKIEVMIYKTPIRKRSNMLVYKPTPIWLFKPTQKIKEKPKEMTIEDWFNKNQLLVKTKFQVR